MGNWPDVVQQQAALFRSVGLRPMIGVLGIYPGRFLRSVGDVVYHSKELREFETPTLYKLWDWCKTHPDDSVIYCHTKGVSRPSTKLTAWRKLMEHMVVLRWRENLEMLKDVDAVGVNWRTNAPYWPTPHFTGTFWHARADYINTLPDPWWYRENGGSEHKPRFFRRGAEHGWQRLHAEMWIGANPNIRVYSHCCRDRRISNLRLLLKLLRAVGHPEYAR